MRSLGIFTLRLSLLLGLLLIVGCSEIQSDSTEVETVPVTISVERSGNLITGIGKVTVYIDGKNVMKLKNNQSKSVKLSLAIGRHFIQTKGQGDKSAKVEFEVTAGESNNFLYHTEISSMYGVNLERVL